MTTRTLDRLVHFDERSRDYPVRAALPEVGLLRTRAWRAPLHLDQGPDGACVGFGWTHWRSVQPPATRRLKYQDAFALYRRAQQLDEWPGENYSGSSVLGGAKATLETKDLWEYRWCFSLDDVLRTLSYQGPVVTGTNWREGMFQPDPDTMQIRPTGDVAGGHCYLLTAIDSVRRRLRVHNSWGLGWGHRGTAWIGWDDYEGLLLDQGDACVGIR